MEISILNIFLMLCLKNLVLSSSAEEFTYTSRSIRPYAIIPFEFGKPLEMVCDTLNMEQVNIEWKKDSQFFKPSERILFSQTGNQHVINITNSVYEDAGNYSCGFTISGTYHPLASAIVVSNFHVKTPEIQEIFNGETLTIKCNVTGNPTPNIYWRHITSFHDTTIKNSTEKYELNEVNGTKNAQITIPYIQYSDVGYMYCIATSPYVDTVRASKCTIQLKKYAPWWPFTAIMLEVIIFCCILWYIVNRCYEEKEIKCEVAEEIECHSLNQTVDPQSETSTWESESSHENDVFLNSNIILINVFGSCPQNRSSVRNTTL